MAKYQIAEAARDDLFDIYQYGLATYGEKVADEFYASLFEAFELIAEAPDRWHRVDYIREGYRRYVFKRGKVRISIYYRIDHDVVQIMALLQRQSQDRHLE